MADVDAPAQTGDDWYAAAEEEGLRLVGELRDEIDEALTLRDALYEERADLFLRLADEEGVTQQALADAAGIGFQAVSQNIARARARRDST